MPQLLENLNNNKFLSYLPNVLIKGVNYSPKNCFSKPVNPLPAVDPELWPCTPEKRKETYLPFQSRRGCPFNCTYCPNTLIEGWKLRKPSPEIVVQSIINHVSKGYRKLYFTDNVFNLPLSYSKELCHQIIRSGVDISWVCSIYHRKADNRLALLMAQAGCEEINLSFERGDSLLRPVFYLEKELQDWIFYTAASWLKVRPNWQCGACVSTD